MPRRPREAYTQFTGGDAAAPSASGPTRMDKSAPSTTRQKMDVTGAFSGPSKPKGKAVGYEASKKLPTMQGFFNKKSPYTKAQDKRAAAKKSFAGKFAGFGAGASGKGAGKFFGALSKVAKGKK